MWPRAAAVPFLAVALAAPLLDQEAHGPPGQLQPTIEAFFYLKGSNPAGVAVNHSHSVHADYVMGYGLSDIPLMELDLGNIHEPGPFREVRNHVLSKRAAAR